MFGTTKTIMATFGDKFALCIVFYGFYFHFPLYLSVTQYRKIQNNQNFLNFFLYFFQNRDILYHVHDYDKKRGMLYAEFFRTFKKIT